MNCSQKHSTERKIHENLERFVTIVFSTTGMVQTRYTRKVKAKIFFIQHLFLRRKSDSANQNPVDFDIEAKHYNNTYQCTKSVIRHKMNYNAIRSDYIV